MPVSFSGLCSTVALVVVLVGFGRRQSHQSRCSPALSEAVFCVVCQEVMEAKEDIRVPGPWQSIG